MQRMKARKESRDSNNVLSEWKIDAEAESVRGGELSSDPAWRLAVEPRRLWRRYLVGSPLFLVRVLRWQLQGRNR